MDTQLPDALITKRIKALAEERNKIIALDPEEGLKRILDAPVPAALVHSFPEQDLYLLIQDLDPEGMPALLSLASNRQWEYILDMDVWERDRIDAHTVTRWMDLLLKADRRRFLRWISHEKINLFEFYLNKNIDLVIRAHDQDPADFGEGFFSFDGTLYFRIRPFKTEAPINGEPAPQDKVRRDFLMTLLKELAREDPIQYRSLLLESAAMIPAEVEEESFRMRNVRLAEKGFLPFDEAIGVYQPLKPENLQRRSASEGSPPASYRTPQYPNSRAQAGSLFGIALEDHFPDEQREHIQYEFAFLVNQVTVADQKTVRNKADLDLLVKKVCGIVTIGLETLSRPDAGDNLKEYTRLIKQSSLIDIFRVGYGAVLDLKWKVEAWMPRSWFTRQGLLLSFWGADGMGVLGGLLIKRPLYYTHDPSGIVYREFSSLDDIQKTKKALAWIIDFDALLAETAIDVGSHDFQGLLTGSNLLLTLWSRNYVGLPAAMAPVGLDRFALFWNTLWNKKGKSRVIHAHMKAHFLDWLSKQTGMSGDRLTRRWGHILEDIFNSLESEYRDVAFQDLRPEYVHAFFLE